MNITSRKAGSTGRRRGRRHVVRAVARLAGWEKVGDQPRVLWIVLPGEDGREYVIEASEAELVELVAAAQGEGGVRCR